MAIHLLLFFSAIRQRPKFNCYSQPNTKLLNKNKKYFIISFVKSISENFIRCISLNPLFFNQKNTFFFPRKQKQIYSKYLPSLTIHFSHLAGNLCIPRQKNSSSFEADHSSSYFRTSS